LESVNIVNIVTRAENACD